MMNNDSLEDLEWMRDRLTQDLAMQEEMLAVLKGTPGQERLAEALQTNIDNGGLMMRDLVDEIEEKKRDLI